MITGILGPQVTTTIRLAPAVPAVLIDPGQLDQVLVNLAVNARDAMPHGGTFTVATEVREATGGGGGSTLAISVADTGCGMDPATVAKAFEPFFTTKGEEGTGLGLAVVHGIVHQAGGTISCESEPGRGTTFRLVFPAASGPVEISPSASIIGAGPLTPVGWPHRRQSAGSTRGRPHARASRCARRRATQRDGRGYIARRLCEADALITDVVMPGLTGPDLVDELRQRQCEKPVIFISGYANHELVERVRKSPNSTLVTKPFTAEAIIGRLD